MTAHWSIVILVSARNGAVTFSSKFAATRLPSN